MKFPPPPMGANLPDYIVNGFYDFFEGTLSHQDLEKQVEWAYKAGLIDRGQVRACAAWVRQAAAVIHASIASPAKILPPSSGYMQIGPLVTTSQVNMSTSTYPMWGPLKPPGKADPLLSIDQMLALMKGQSKLPAKASKTLPTSTVTHEVIGYRVWKLGQREWAHLPRSPVTIMEAEAIPYAPEIKRGVSWFLISTTADHVWEGPVLDAGGPPATTKPPWGYEYDKDTHGIHGIYCYRTLTKAVSEWMGWVTWASGDFPVIGAVSLTGTVVVHEAGYRARRALVKGLCLSPSMALTHGIPMMKKIVKDLGDRYDCPVTDSITTFYEVIHENREGSGGVGGGPATDS